MNMRSSLVRLSIDLLCIAPAVCTYGGGKTADTIISQPGSLSRSGVWPVLAKPTL